MVSIDDKRVSDGCSSSEPRFAFLSKDSYLPGGCMKQQTTKPLAALLARCKAGPSSIPACRINRLLAKKYVGSWTELPKPVRIIAAPIPRYRPPTPSAR